MLQRTVVFWVVALLFAVVPWAHADDDKVLDDLARLRSETNVFTASPPGPVVEKTNAPQGNDYGIRVAKLIKSHWRDCVFDQKTNLVATLEINIDPQGMVATRVQSSSGNAVFDASALLAVQDMGQAPPPPDMKPFVMWLRFNYIP